MPVLAMDMVGPPLRIRSRFRFRKEFGRTCPIGRGREAVSGDRFRSSGTGSRGLAGRDPE